MCRIPFTVKGSAPGLPAGRGGASCQLHRLPGMLESACRFLVISLGEPGVAGGWGPANSQCYFWPGCSPNITRPKIAYVWAGLSPAPLSPLRKSEQRPGLCVSLFSLKITVLGQPRPIQGPSAQWRQASFAPPVLFHGAPLLSAFSGPYLSPSILHSRNRKTCMPPPWDAFLLHLYHRVSEQEGSKNHLVRSFEFAG